MFAIRVIYWLRSRRRTYYTPAWTLANQRFRKMCADFHRNRRQNTGTGDFVRSYIAFHHVSKEKRFIDFFFWFFFSKAISTIRNRWICPSKATSRRRHAARSRTNRTNYSAKCAQRVSTDRRFWNGTWEPTQVRRIR